MQTIVKAIEREDRLPSGDLDEWEEWINEQAEVTIDLSGINEDLFAVLMDKTESEAYFRVKSVEPGNGIEAFVKIVKWCMGTSGLGLQEKARQIMSPIPPKTEGDIAESVEKWLEGLRVISGHKGYEMSYRLRVTALKMLMIGKAKDNFEQWEEELRDDTEDNWKRLLGKVQDYATRRRLEANYAKTKGDPMDITEVIDNWDNQEGYYGEWGDAWEDGGYGNIDAVGKGYKGKGYKGKGKGVKKGKGKGKSGSFEGQCYSCGEYGHSARFCPYASGKAKGKGKEQTICYSCGNAGHIASQCPKGKGKGTAMAWLNQGQGKGANGGQWNIGSVQQTLPQAIGTQEVNLSEFTPPVWDTGNQAIEADFGGQWDSTINEISTDNNWTLVTRKARGIKDMKAVRAINCTYGNHLHSIERAGNPM